MGAGSCNSKKRMDTITRHKCNDAKEELERLYVIDDVPRGSGAFGRVYNAHSRTDEDTLFAIKQMDIDGLSVKKVEMISNEVKILNSLDHPNIVKYYEIYQDKHNLYIVMENWRGETMFNKMVNGAKFSEKACWRIAQKLLRAINHCHTGKVTHRDIKPENVILDDHDNPKLIDFGLSKNATAQQILKSMAGTPYYMAPEILMGKIYKEKVDIWSLGVLFYTILWGYRPFDGQRAEDVFDAVKSGKYKMSGKNWSKISSSARNLVSKMLVLNPK